MFIFLLRISLMTLRLTFGIWVCCLNFVVARVFALVVRCKVMMLFVYFRVGKNRDTRRELAAGAGLTGWFLPGGFSHKAGPIKHQLVLVCRSGGSACKNQSKPMIYTDLLGIVNFLHNPSPLSLQRFCNLPGLMDGLIQIQHLLLELMNQQGRS